ncbi:MAG: hypothetical protein AAB503_02050 [Patescibacteria group bacterium]|mgnify:FL=1
MSKGNLIRAPYSEITAAIELLDSLEVTPEHLAELRKASSWRKTITSGVVSGDQYLLSLLGLEISAKKAGFSNDDLSKLAGDDDLMKRLFQVVRGYAEVKEIEHLIDCDADPFLPNSSWKVEEHRKGGFWKWNENNVILYLSEQQQKKKVISGNDLRKELTDKPVLNANVLNYLLKNPHLIPEVWKGKFIFFWGTIYRDSDGILSVRYLNWYGDRWYWSWVWLENVWGEFCPAALRASSSVLNP